MHQTRARVTVNPSFLIRRGGKHLLGASAEKSHKRGARAHANGKVVDRRHVAEEVERGRHQDEEEDCRVCWCCRE